MTTPFHGYTVVEDDNLTGLDLRAIGNALIYREAINPDFTVHPNALTFTDSASSFKLSFTEDEDGVLTAWTLTNTDTGDELEGDLYTRGSGVLMLDAIANATQGRSFQKLTVEITSSGYAMTERSDYAAALRKVADELEAGESEITALDANGNRCGTAKIG